MIHLEMGFASLFDFTVKHLGLSEASAYRRIATMRLVREIPAIKNSLDGRANPDERCGRSYVLSRREEAGTETNPR